MSFLAPWFLLGGLAIAAPIVFHLIRRVVRERIPFSSIMFLKSTPPRLTRRSRIEHWWLLVLRCLCLLLLAIGFARPFFAKDNVLPATAGEARRLVLLVDTSASMRREGVWDKAKAVAERYLGQAGIGDQIALLTFDRQPRSVFSFAEWSAWPPNERASLARARLKSIDPGWKGTQLGLALTSAAEQFADDADAKFPGKRELILISDLQEGARLDGLQGHEWPANFQVTIERVDAKHRNNAGLGIAGDAVRNPVAADSHVRVANARDSEREKFQLNWNSKLTGAGPGKPTEIYLPPGQIRTFPVSNISTGAVVRQLQLSGDDEPFDNALYLVTPETERVSIAWFGLESQNDPYGMRYYLQRVFPETPQREVRLIAPTTNQVFSSDLLKQSAFAVITTNLSEREVAEVRDGMNQGKTALLVLADAGMSRTLAALGGFQEASVSEAAGDYALLSEIDFTHPLFAPFADPRFSDFTHIHFWKHRRWEIPKAGASRVLGRFDDDAPALVQVPVGKGNLIVLTSGWNPGDSQLAVSSKFPPLMQTLLDWSGAATPKRFQFETGDSIPSPIASGATVQWFAPDGKSQSLPAGAAFGATEETGIYRATAAGKEHRFAVNLPLDESRTAPLSEDELSRLGVPLKSGQPSIAQQQAIAQRLERTELENRQKLWRWLIAGALVAVLAESILSGWLSRRSKPAEVAA